MKSWILPVGAAVVAGLGIGWYLIYGSNGVINAAPSNTKPATNTTNNTQQQSTNTPPVTKSPGTVQYDDAAAKAAAAKKAADAAAVAAALAARKLAEERAKQLEAEAYNYLQQAQQASSMGDDTAAEQYKSQSDYLYEQAKKVRQDAGISVSTGGLFNDESIGNNVFGGICNVGWRPRNTVLAAHARRS